MINKISVKNVAAYDDNGITIDNLEKINYIYGANGCGKTTISNLLSNPYDEKFKDCSIEWCNNITKKVLVYNKTFRDNNFNESDIAGIFTLGQATHDEMVELQNKKEELKNYETSIVSFKNSLVNCKKKMSDEESDFKEIAWKDIYKKNELKFKMAFQGFLRKESFSSKIKSIELHKEDNINRDDIEKKAVELLDSVPEKKDFLNIISYDSIKEVENFSIWNECIIGKQDVPIAKLINKLQNSDWVNQGRKYIYPGGKCPFCQKNTIDDDFIQQIGDFFNEEFEKNIEKLKKEKNKYLLLKNELLENSNIIINNLNDKNKLVVQKLLGNILNCFRDNEEKINAKIEEPSKKIHLDSIGNYIGKINEVINEENKKIDTHNKMVDNYQNEKEKLIDNIWKLLAKENNELINKHKEKISKLNNGIQALTQKVTDAEIKKQQIEMEIKESSKLITSVQPAVDEINRLLHSYGFNNFSIECSREKENHYQIQRPDGSLVKSTLSEGEVTFITFLYFLQLVKGSQNNEEVAMDRIIIIDDPISSLDSNVLFIVSSLLKDVIYAVLNGSSNIKQVIVLTHNVYFHKEISFMGNGKNSNKNVHYWILRKKNEVTNLQYYGINNPISSSYELLWKELKDENNNSVITIQNVMRRIIENYFKILGKYKDDELIEKFPNYESKQICRSLLSWINDGSHCMPDDLYVETLDDSIERYKEVFKKIFEYTGQIEHYNMMMGLE